MQRNRRSLNGMWTYQPTASAVIREGGSIEFGDDSIPPPGTMAVPGHWDGTPLGEFFGSVRFTRTFDVMPDEIEGNDLWLCFAAVDYFADVIVNGRHVGDHEGYFQPFSFNLAGYLRAGENTLDVVVTHPKEEPGTVWPHRKRMIKGVLSHWDCRPGGWNLEHGQDRHSGGIWGDVYLEARSRLHIGNISIRTRLVPLETPFGESRVELNTAELGHKAVVTVHVEIEGGSGEIGLRARFGEHASTTRMVNLDARGGRHTLVVEIVDPPLWWTWDLGTPHLETCELELTRDGDVIDAVTETYGIRDLHVDFERGEWWLNGRRVFVRGTNIVPSLWLGTYDDSTLQRDFELMRSAGMNGVRTCVHINKRAFYDMCDREGMLVWQDFPLQWGYVESPEFAANAIDQAHDMVRTLGNHPSIGVWCCQNESTFQNKYVLDPVLADAIASCDGSRSVRATSLYSEHAYPGWYEPDYHAYADLPGTPTLTEFGAQAVPSIEIMHLMAGDTFPPDRDVLAYHNMQWNETENVAHVPSGDSLEAFVANSQRHQARCLKYGIERYRKAKYVSLGGMFQFMFVDGWPSVTWSIVDVDRVPKEGYFSVQQAYQPTLFAADWLAGEDEVWTITPWIVNDRHELLQDVAWEVAIRHGHGTGTSTLAAGQITLESDAGAIELPPIALPGLVGDDVVELTLIHQQRFLCINTYSVDGEWAGMGDVLAEPPGRR